MPKSATAVDPMVKPDPNLEKRIPSYCRTAGSLGRLLSSPSALKDLTLLEIGRIEYTCPRQVSGHVYTMHKRGPYQLLNLKH